MVCAYILIPTQVGPSSTVAAAIADLPGVTMAEDVTGPYNTRATTCTAHVAF